MKPAATAALALALSLALVPVTRADPAAPAAPGPAPADPAPPPSTAAARDTEVWYHILLGELAARRGRFDVAVSEYQAAAAASADVRVTERAFAVALYARDPAAAAGIARRWQTLLPEAIPPRQALALALIEGVDVESALEPLAWLREHFAVQDQQDGFAAVANLLGQARERQAAWQALARLSAQQPDSRFGHYYAAGAALAAGEGIAAERELQTALKLAPDWAPAWQMRARLVLDRGDLPAALEVLSAAVTQLPKDTALRTAYARALFLANRYDEAGEQFDRLLADNPRDSNARLALAGIAFEAKQYDRAVALLKDLLGSGENPGDIEFQLGRVEEARGDYAAARAWYEKVTDGDRRLGARIRLGALKLAEGDEPGMHAWFNAERAAHPDDAVALFIGEAEVLRQKDLIQPAWAVLTAALAGHPDDTDLLYARALVAERLDRIGETESDLRRVLELDPEHGQALNALGYTLADRTDRLAEAEDLIRRALEKLPSDAAVLDSMGWVLYRQGKAAEGLPYLERAQGLSLEPEILAHLVEVLWTLGRQDEARALWERGAQRTPGDRFLQQVREKLKW
ncbi:MAG: tetratricopeptide repeat protein [Proteobacteria bacterium]|nr:tetratricopeptide repeat protein [Pseudomonadota bacterium]